MQKIEQFILINTKNQELEYLNSELNLMRQKYDQIESARWDLNNEKHIIQNQMSKEDVCDLIEILLDDRAKSLSGQVLNVGGVR